MFFIQPFACSAEEKVDGNPPTINIYGLILTFVYMIMNWRPSSRKTGPQRRPHSWGIPMGRQINLKLTFVKCEPFGGTVPHRLQKHNCVYVLIGILFNVVYGWEHCFCAALPNTHTLSGGTLIFDGRPPINALHTTRFGWEAVALLANTWLHKAWQLLSPLTPP